MLSVLPRIQTSCRYSLRRHRKGKTENQGTSEALFLLKKQLNYFKIVKLECTCIHYPRRRGLLVLVVGKASLGFWGWR